jgi:hypothetical protein
LALLLKSTMSPILSLQAIGTLAPCWVGAASWTLVFNVSLNFCWDIETLTINGSSCRND